MVTAYLVRGLFFPWHTPVVDRSLQNASHRGNRNLKLRSGYTLSSTPGYPQGRVGFRFRASQPSIIVFVPRFALAQCRKWSRAKIIKFKFSEGHRKSRHKQAFSYLHFLHNPTHSGLTLTPICCPLSDSTNHIPEERKKKTEDPLSSSITHTYLSHPENLALRYLPHRKGTYPTSRSRVRLVVRAFCDWIAAGICKVSSPYASQK